MFRQGFGELVTDDSIDIFAALLEQKVMRFLKSVAAIKVIGIDHRKVLLHGIFGAEDGMSGAPGLGPALRYGKTIEVFIHLLVYILGFNPSFQLWLKNIPEVFGKILSDYKD